MTGTKWQFEFDAEAWIRGATRFGGEYGKTAAPKFDDVSQKLYQLTQARVHVISGELKASGKVEPASSGKSGFGIESLEGGVVYTSDHGIWEMRRGGEHDFLTEPLSRVRDDYAKVFEFAFETVVKGWR